MKIYAILLFLLLSLGGCENSGCIRPSKPKYPYGTPDRIVETTEGQEITLRYEYHNIDGYVLICVSSFSANPCSDWICYESHWITDSLGQYQLVETIEVDY